MQILTRPAQSNCSGNAPTLHRFGLATANLEPMRARYSKFLGVSPGQESHAVANDRVNRRIAIIGDDEIHDLESDHCHRAQHLAFDYPSVDDLLSTYARLKELGIKPVAATCNSLTIAFYYLHPDDNCVAVDAREPVSAHETHL